MSEEKKAFNVTDRRHFTAEGEVRGTPEEAPPAAPSPPSGPEPEDPGVDAERTGERFDFSALLVSLAAQASLLLGEMAPPPGEPAPPPDLGAARAVIDLIEDLQRRTEGRRSRDEDRLLEGLLYDLRLRYVSRTGRM